MFHVYNNCILVFDSLFWDLAHSTCFINIALEGKTLHLWISGNQKVSDKFKIYTFVNFFLANASLYHHSLFEIF